MKNTNIKTWHVSIDVEYDPENITPEDLEKLIEQIGLAIKGMRAIRKKAFSLLCKIKTYAGLKTLKVDNIEHIKKL